MKLNSIGTADIFTLGYFFKCVRPEGCPAFLVSQRENLIFTPAFTKM